ncbi:hypothetical protein H0H81_008002 [Sphagnurus paluster]|uniref:Major facilitator superfamily (MFS) profile domain-containing protein n=1 Tax=Sphagnurus paluster TaxID=117069 RepID=A0A9P7GQG7_9AGAR|nr:hypothetical protein H0H81_008002 [Sphagnurus paluster]
MAVSTSPLPSDLLGKFKLSSSSHGDAESTVERAGTSAFEHKTMRKIDLRLLPLLGMLYALALIDRTNLGVARIAGMDRDLKLSIGYRYSIVSALYFIPYIIFQLPSNIFLRQLGVCGWLTFCVLAWGAVQLAMGFVPNWELLGLCRVLLGLFEAGFFPAMVFIITTWYTRHEVQKRLAAFYVVSIFTGGFSAIFAYVLSLLGGKQGIPGWAWIFIIEGAITILFGIIAWFYISDFPDQNTFLSQEETAFILERVERDRGDSIPDELTKKKLSSNNITSHTKRAVSTAMIISFGGIGGIFATTVFRQADFPKYLPGIYATIACQITLLILLGITTLHFWKQNKLIRACGTPSSREGHLGFLYTL